MRQDLLATPRWSWLGEAMTRWCAEPLTAADGVAVEGLPPILTEWFALVGARLVPMDNVLLGPDRVRGTEHGIEFWSENQGVCWLVADGDEAVFVDDDGPHGRGPLADALRSAVLLGMLEGAVGGSGNGPLGAFAPGVRGGDVRADGARASALLPWVAGSELLAPGLREAPGLIVNVLPPYVWWLADPVGAARLADLIPVPAAEPTEVVLTFDSLDDAGLALLVDSIGLPLAFVRDAVRAAAAPWGEVTLSVGGRRTPGYVLRTTAPEALVPALLAAVPEPVRANAVVAARPMMAATATMVHGRPDFQLPDAFRRG